MTACRCLVVLMMAAALSSLASLGCAAPLEVHELEAAPQRYLNQDLDVVGRFRTATAGEMALVDSQIVFRVPPRSAALRNGAQNVEVRGRLTREGDRWVFTAAEVARAPAERVEFERRRRLITPGATTALWELSRWVRQRAEWYDDDELRRLADGALNDAVSEQRARLVRSRSSDELMALAAEAAAEGLPAERIDELRHEALAMQLDSAKSAKAAAALAAAIVTTFPGAAQPGDGNWPAPLAEYRADFAAVFAKQPAAGRAALVRLLATEAIAAELEALATSTPEKLPDWVARAQRELPDRPEVLARLQLATARRDAREPGRLSRGRLVEVAAELRRLGEPTEADALLRRGLHAARTRLDAEDADGRVDLADAYLELLHDRAAAAELYLEAWRLAPRMPELPEKLSALGYTLQGNVWRSDKPEAPVAPALDRVNPLQNGASADQVVKTLGRPSRVSRSITGSGVTEQWIYEGPPRLDVYLRRPVGSRTATVMGIRSP